MLKSEFEVGWHDIRSQDYVGYSSGYSYKSHCAVGTTNGAGAHNVQIFVISPDKVVMHALAGFWAPADLARELRFAKVLYRLWQDEDRTLAQKKDMYWRLQTLEPRNHPPETFARSSWQSFDVRTERKRQGDRDTVLDALVPVTAAVGGEPRMGRATATNRQALLPMMKPLNVLVHERMAVRAFVPFDEFDIEAFIDYGQMHYDLNCRHDKGIRFSGQDRLMRKRRIAVKKKRRLLVRASN